jgi:hypothetical protein
MSSIVLKKKPKKNVGLNIEDFKYLDKKQLPKLILGIKIDPSEFNEELSSYGYEFTPGKEWHKIAHQSAGLGCHQHYLIGTFLKPRSLLVAGGMQHLTKKWLGTNTGVGKISLQEIKNYHNDLVSIFAADCNHSFRDLNEGYYPIDLEYISRFTDEELPKNLDDLIIWKDGFQRAAHAGKLFNLVVLGPNSD